MKQKLKGLALNYYKEGWNDAIEKMLKIIRKRKCR